MSSECIFCRMVAGEIPCEIVYENDDVLAFMDIAPIIPGHTLIIPKTHQESLMVTPVPLLGKLMAAAKIVATAQTSAFNADGINILQNNGSAAGQAVFHIHLHVIPRFKKDGHQWNWNTAPYESPADMTRLADKIRKEI